MNTPRVNRNLFVAQSLKLKKESEFGLLKPSVPVNSYNTQIFGISFYSSSP